MALTQRGNTRRTIILLSILGVIVIGGGVYLWTQNRPVDLGTTPDSDVVTPIHQRPIVTDFSDELFNDPRFTDLEQQSPVVITPGVIGKSNPFSPTL